MVQAHESILPECRTQFDQTNKVADQMVRQLDKLNEKVGLLITDSAVMRESVENHQHSLQDGLLQQEVRFQAELKNQETRFQLTASRIWKCLFVLMVGASVGGGGVALDRLVF